jgi:hypothetical protein
MDNDQFIAQKVAEFKGQTPPPPSKQEKPHESDESDESSLEYEHNVAPPDDLDLVLNNVIHLSL